jgi:hypothetical protein
MFGGTDKIDCENMAIYLSENNIITSISSNISSTPGIEYGCRLHQSVDSKKDIENIWNLLKIRYDFKCAHLKLGDVYDGCILNFLVPSKCPGAKNK